MLQHAHVRPEGVAKGDILPLKEPPEPPKIRMMNQVVTPIPKCKKRVFGIWE